MINNISFFKAIKFYDSYISLQDHLLINTTICPMYGPFTQVCITCWVCTSGVQKHDLLKFICTFKTHTAYELLNITRALTHSKQKSEKKLVV